MPTPFLNDHHKTLSLDPAYPQNDDQGPPLVDLASGPGMLRPRSPGNVLCHGTEPFEKESLRNLLFNPAHAAHVGNHGWRDPVSLVSASQNPPQCLAHRRLLDTYSELWENNSTNERKGNNHFWNHTLPLVGKPGPCQKILLHSPQ